jgi:hypothetical protein
VHIDKEPDPLVLCGITRGDDGRIYANADFRKAGGIDGY